MDPIGRDALRPEVVERLRAGGEAEVGQDVGDPPVDLLGHGHVEASEPSLDVGEGQTQLARHERRREGRVHVAVDGDERRVETAERRLEGRQQGGSLAGLGSGPDAEVDVGLGQPELAEEHLRHRPVVVLTRVDDDLVRLARGESADDRAGLHEVRPRADDVDDRAGHAAVAGVAQPAPRRSTWCGRTDRPRELFTVSTTRSASA